MLIHALATIEHGAVGNHAVGINAALAESGVKVRSYAETIREDFASTFSPMSDLAASVSSFDVVFYQFANPSPMADLLYESDCKVILNYHNVTPAHFFSRWSPHTASAVSRARAQLARMAPICSSAVAVSEYNAAELRDLGYRNVEVIPPVFSDRFFTSEKNNSSSSSSSSSSWLYVGRIAPHKNINILLRSFELYRDYVDNKAQLTIVGSTDTPVYGKAIDELIKGRNFGDSVKVISRAHIDELVKAYQEASVFVSASEHEGFCVPVVEAMAIGLPVVVVNAAALAETAASAGVLVENADPELIADAVARVEKDPSLKNELIEKGFSRAQKFDPRLSAQRYAEYLREFA